LGFNDARTQVMGGAKEVTNTGDFRARTPRGKKKRIEATAAGTKNPYAGLEKRGAAAAARGVATGFSVAAVKE